MEVLGQFVEWVPVCPEVEVGLGTPREPMRLMGNPRKPRLVTVKTDRDFTKEMATFSKRKVRELDALDLSGYVFKKDSPSCGLERVRLFNRLGAPRRNGVGLFARAIVERFPLIPVEEESRFCHPALREHFIERVLCYHRWRHLARGPVTRKALVAFHAEHQSLLLAHSRKHDQALGRLVAQAHRYRPKELVERYGKLFMEALAVKAPARKRVDVLRHLAGHMKGILGGSPGGTG